VLAAVLLFEARSRATANVSAVARNWSSTGVATWPLRLTLGNADHAVSITAVSSDDYAVALGHEVIEVSIAERGDGSVRFTVLGLQQTARFAAGAGTLHLDVGGNVFVVRETTLETGGSARRDGSSRLVAPMNGAVVSVLAKPGDPVARGQRVVVLEAMKMQHEIAAERDGTIAAINVKKGDQVTTRQLLAVLATEPAEQHEGSS
jgi:geranyl-CoA carboxylase alpha subunit